MANACRTCGRWPSLFELEGSTIESEPQVNAPSQVYEPEVVEVDYAEPETYDAPEAPGRYNEPVNDETEPQKPLWQRVASMIVPIGVVLYIVISALANRDAG